MPVPTPDTPTATSSAVPGPAAPSQRRPPTGDPPPSPARRPGKTPSRDFLPRETHGGWLSAGSPLVRIHAFMIKCASVYGVFLIFAALPWVQDQFIYMHNARWPWNPNFYAPEQYGLELHRARNLHLTTRDNVTIGAWHILPEEYYFNISTAWPLAADDQQGQYRDEKQEGEQERKNSANPSFSASAYDTALGTHQSVIFLHGNAASRAVSFRVDLYKDIARAFNANVLVLDYRGFADSQERPSEHGLVLDARAAWDWIQGTRRQLDVDVTQLWGEAPGSGITIFGQSLGSAVAAQVARELTLEGTPPQGVVLAAPFASLQEVVTGYGLLGFPVFGPLELLPGGHVLLSKVVHASWNTSDALSRTISHLPHLSQTDFPHIVLTHARDDPVIPCAHSEWLLDRALVAYGQDQLPVKPYESLLSVPKFGPRAKKEMERFEGYIRAVHRLKAEATLTENLVGVTAEVEEEGQGKAQVETLSIPHSLAPLPIQDDQQREGSPKPPTDPSPHSTFSLIRYDHGGHEYLAPGILSVAARLVGAQL